jgi:prepilin-type N-terminal cleavage/methylation domain-containing protein
MTRSQSGFTLIEVLVAVVVLGLAAAATASGFRSTTSFLGDNALHAEAVTLAQRAVEDLRTIPFEQIDDGARESEDGTYLLTTEVTPDFPERGMKKIVVTVSWDWKGEVRSYALQTVYSRVTKN